MSIPSLDQRLGTILPTSTESDAPLPTAQRSESEDIGEPVVVAGGASGVIADALASGAKKAGTFVRETVGPTVQGAMGKVGQILDPMLEQGARADVKPKIVESTQLTPTAPPAPAPASALNPKKKSVTPATAAEMMELGAARRAGIDEGGPLISPSPSSAQLQAGVQEGRISTLPFDSEEMRATVAAATDRALKDEKFSKMTVADMFKSAIDAGVPEATARRIFAGIPLETKIGNNEITKSVAGIVSLHDDSVLQLDDLFRKLEAGQLDDVGKLQLRQQITYHDLVARQLEGASVDVSRSMNVFKRVKDPSVNFTPTQIRAMLDELGGDDALYDIAKAYMDPSASRKTKNALLREGLGAKTRDVWIFSYMANLLNDIGTHAVNIGSGALQLAAAPIERAVAIPIGMARTKLPGAVQDRYYGEDIIAGTSGFWNGTIDGWIAASHTMKTGERIGMKSEQRVNPISAENLSNIPVRTGNLVAGAADIATSAVAGMPLPVSPMLGSWADAGREIWRTPDLSNTWAGKFIDGLGFVQGMSLRVMSSADEFIGMNAARYQLHEEAWRFSNKEYDKMVAAGMSPDDAMKEAQTLTKTFLSERPKEMQAGVDKFKKQATLSDDFDRETKLGNAYWKLDHLMQVPVLKAFNPFQKAVSQLFVEGTARVPGLNLISPRFHEEWSKGGRHRDLAMSRLAIGSSAIALSAKMTLDNRLTGGGPESPEDRAALTAMGWQPHSFILDNDEMSQENIDRVGKVLELTKGRGDFEGKLFASFGRWQPIAQPLAVGAGIGDMLKFHTPKPGEEDDPDSAFSAIIDMVKVGSVASVEMMAEHPTMQSFGDMLRIFRGKFSDKGEQFAAAADKLAGQYAGFLFTGTPGVGALNSTAMGHIERLTDPQKRTSMADVMDAPYGLRAFYELQQKVKSKLPFFNKDVPVDLDELGREKLVQNRYSDYVGNWNPFYSITAGKRSETDEALALIDHGINKASMTWDGVRLSATQYQRFKKLTGQDIKFSPSELGIDAPDDTPVNLEKAIPLMLKFQEQDHVDAGIPFHKGDAQKEVDKLVTFYRTRAKDRMIGQDSGDDITPWEPVGSMNGLVDDKIEYPELQQLVKRNRSHQKMYGR